MRKNRSATMATGRVEGRMKSSAQFAPKSMDRTRPQSLYLAAVQGRRRGRASVPDRLGGTYFPARVACGGEACAGDGPSEGYASRSARSGWRAVDTSNTSAVLNGRTGTYMDGELTASPVPKNNK